MTMKQIISDQTNKTEQLSPVLEKLRQADQGFKVPDGYFNSLSPRIVESIKKQENSSFLKIVVPSFSKPVVWAPVMATVIVAVLLIFVVPGKKDSTLPVADEWTQINMAYDASYAEEALLAESNFIENYIENKGIRYVASASLTTANEPTVDEITDYLKEHEIEMDILNGY
jgi:hypothetical protein